MKRAESGSAQTVWTILVAIAVGVAALIQLKSTLSEKPSPSFQASSSPSVPELTRSPSKQLDE